ncbi:MAG: lactate utilization protein [Oscillospiraceae bacterium]|nr:lactate utilization protein [Oscillospiraceae bacterium]
MDFAHVEHALAQRGFGVHSFENAGQAAAYLRQALADAPQVAFGGSVTLQEMGLAQALRADGREVLWHWEVPAADRPPLLRRAMLADAYLCSANALSSDGRIVQIDGGGNRVAALCYGPARIYLVIGQNKLVQGNGLLAAISRIKRDACPRNARRIGLNTPCASAGTCDEQHCTESICRFTLVLTRPASWQNIDVLLVDEDLGY